MSKKQVILAYSGGLDTTYCAMYLSRDRDMEVHAVTIQTGGFSAEELAQIESRAKALGVATYTCLDVTLDYYESCIKYLIFGNVLKNGTYPLSVSAERMCQAIAIAQFAKTKGIHTIAHGSTGAGNDQIRFDMVFQTLLPDVEIITPIRDLQLSREDEINYLKAQGVAMNFDKAQYSINKGLWGTSVGGKETLSSRHTLPEAAWPTPVTAKEALQISLQFEKGELVGIDNQTFEHPVAAIQHLQMIAQPFGIGRDIHVGDTIIGIKGRVGFEAAAPILIIKAHHLLEKHTLSKWQLTWKDQLSNWYGNSLHEGQMLDPVMRNIEQFMADTQHNVTGRVFITLHPHRYELEGVESPHDLMNSQFGSYGEMNTGWTGEDARGFAKIFGNANAIYHTINETK